MPTTNLRSLGLACMLLGMGSPHAEAAPKSGAGATVACNQFAFDLLGKLPAKGNLIFSSLSAETALAMTSGGARGATLAQMNRTLHLANLGDSHAGMGKLVTSLNELDGREGLALRVANRIWTRKGVVLEPPFVKLTADRYRAPVATTDFKNNTEGSRKAINKWVADQTRTMIGELLKAGMITAATPMVLVNAVYMKGQWLNAFDIKATVDGDFHAGASTVKAKMMNRTGSFRYAHGDGVQVLELPYKGGLSMVLFLPDARNGVAALRKKIGDRYGDWIGMLGEQRVNVSLPRFKARTALQLQDQLKALGMELPFERRADFSGITRTLPLLIGAVIHEAVIEVNEEGTKAAAATAVVMRGGGPPHPIPTFRADHPFLYVIRDTSSGVILFLGHLANPAA